MINSRDQFAKHERTAHGKGKGFLSCFGGKLREVDDIVIAVIVIVVIITAVIFTALDDREISSGGFLQGFRTEDVALPVTGENGDRAIRLGNLIDGGIRLEDRVMSIECHHQVMPQFRGIITGYLRQFFTAGIGQGSVTEIFTDGIHDIQTGSSRGNSLNSSDIIGIYEHITNRDGEDNNRKDIYEQSFKKSFFFIFIQTPALHYLQILIK